MANSSSNTETQGSQSAEYVPEAFHEAAARWARDAGSAEDIAVIRAVSLGIPIEDVSLINLHNFDKVTGLPSASALSHFNVAKDRARAAAHIELTRRLHNHVLTALHTPLSEATTATQKLPCTLAAAPAAAGISKVARALLRGKRVAWAVPIDTLAAAGSDFVTALRQRAWNPVPQDHGLDVWLEPDCCSVGPRAIARLCRETARIAGDAAPAGKVVVVAEGESPWSTWKEKTEAVLWFVCVSVESAVAEMTALERFVFGMMVGVATLSALRSALIS